MKFLALVYGNEQLWGAVEDFGSFVAEVDAFNAALRESGEMVDVQGLLPEPKSIRPGGSVLTDGPYLEAKEYVGSFFLIDVADAARAHEIVASYPALRRVDGGGVELWPLMR